MIEEREFKIGDKVVRNYNTGYGTSIGTVVKITPKRKDVVVDFGRYKETYESDGWQKGGDIWTRSTITLLTPEIEQDLADRKLIATCKDVFAKTKLSAAQARKILEILKDESC